MPCRGWGPALCLRDIRLEDKVEGKTVKIRASDNVLQCVWYIAMS